MLNIGKLRADAVNYYVDSVAPNGADYYFGRGEAPGCWTGSLAPELGLSGVVERTAFERLLAGLHPQTGDVLVGAAGSNARSLARSLDQAAPATPGADALDVAQVAAQLQVSTRAVRHWLDAGEVVKEAVRASTPAEVALNTAESYQSRLQELGDAGETPEDLPPAYLLGVRLGNGARGGHRYRWAIPQSGVDRLREARRPSDARAGWDLVFRPPKSYSVLWAVGAEDLSSAIADIHHQALSDALGYLEDTAATARATAEVGAGRKRVRTGAQGFVVAAFDHRDSRAGDPLLHTHCVVANATRLSDGRWVALDPPGLYRHGLAADAVYQASFRHLAERRLGLASEPVVNGWADVAGVPRPVVEHFSKRSEEIAAELARVGSDSPAARQMAAVASRRAKTLNGADTGLHEQWRAEAAAIGFDGAAVAACLGRTAGADKGGADVDESRIQTLFDRLGSPHGLTEAAATFARPDVVAAVATALGGAVHGPDVVAMADRFLASDRVVRVREHRAGLPRQRILDGRSGAFVDDLANASFTTPELAAIEQRLMSLAVGDMASGNRSWAGPTAPEAVVDDTLADRPQLSDEQRAMVRAVCGSSAVIRPVVGYPGAGKTYATEACVAALAAANVPVIGCAVTAEAADELARATGLSAGACDTIAHTLLDLDHPEYGGLRPRSVVIVDEASTVSHRDLARLVGHVEAVGGALVMVGDPHQHGAVGPGHFFGWLVNREGAVVPTLRANHRQRDIVDADGNVVVSLAAERLANLEYREGRIAEALARRDDAGLVTRAASAEDLYDIVAADWLAEWQAGTRDPMITTRNAVRHQLNVRARRLLDEAGELSGPVLDAAGRSFQVGDYVVARENNRRLRSEGDATWWVKNGSRGTVAALHAEAHELTVDFAGAQGSTHRVRLPTTYLAAGHLEWAYALTDYGVQGRTLGRGKAVVDDTTTAAGAYVATTRGRLENRLYLVDGTVADQRDPDTSHGPPSTRESSFDALAARLGAEVPDALIHEADPWAADAGALAARYNLAQLHAALAPLTATLAAAPADVSRRIAGAEAAVETLAARRQLVETQLSGATGQRSFGRPARRPGASLRAELDGIDRRLDTLNARLAGLRAQAVRRQRYLEDHGDQVARRELLRDAIAGRETKVRLAAPAFVPQEVPAVVAEPDADATQEERHRGRRALEQTALYRDRWSAAAPVGQSDDTPSPITAAPITAALGPRPHAGEAAHDWDQAAGAIADAFEIPCPRPVVVEADPSPAL
jgi:conjugative relaxase-like TrwC/TraI family protein